MYPLNVAVESPNLDQLLELFTSQRQTVPLRLDRRQRSQNLRTQLKRVHITTSPAARLNLLQSRGGGGCYSYDSTAIRPRYDHSTTCVTTGLLHHAENK